MENVQNIQTKSVTFTATSQKVTYVDGNGQKVTEDKEYKGTYTVQLPDTVEGMIALYGNDAVYNAIVSFLIVRLQNIARLGQTDGKTTEEIQKALDEYKFASRRVQTPEEKLLSKLDTPEAIERFVAAAKAQFEALQAAQAKQTAMEFDKVEF